MSSTIDNVTEKLTEDLYQKTRAQLNAFLDETNALLAAGDALHEDRTNLAHERLTDFLKSADRAALPRHEQPPVTHAIEQAKVYVKANPWMAVGAAAGIGLVVSMLLNRRQR